MQVSKRIGILTNKMVYPNIGTIELLKGNDIITTELTLYLKAKVSTTANAVLKDWALLRLIESFTIKAGTTTFDATVHFLQILWDNLIRLRGKGCYVDPIPIGRSNVDVSACLHWHPGIAPYDERGEHNIFDTSVILPPDGKLGMRMTTLNAEIKWGRPEDMGTGVEVHSATMEIVQKYMIMGEQDYKRIFPAEKLPILLTDATIVTIDKIYTNNSFIIEIPKRGVLNSTQLLVLDKDNNIDPHSISDIQILYKTIKTDYMTVPWRIAEVETAKQYQMTFIPAGVICIDWKRVPGASPHVGLPLHGNLGEEIIIGLSTVKTGSRLCVRHHTIALLQPEKKA